MIDKIATKTHYRRDKVLRKMAQVNLTEKVSNHNVTNNMYDKYTKKRFKM